MTVPAVSNTLIVPTVFPLLHINTASSYILVRTPLRYDNTATMNTVLSIVTDTQNICYDAFAVAQIWTRHDNHLIVIDVCKHGIHNVDN